MGGPSSGRLYPESTSLESSDRISIVDRFEPAAVEWRALAQIETVPLVPGRQMLVRLEDEVWIATHRSSTWWNASASGPATILDLQGIDTMLAARRMLFDDALAGAVLRDFGLASGHTALTRRGVAGSPPSPGFPGGEVLVDERIDVAGSAGRVGDSWSVVGHLEDGDRGAGGGVARLCSRGVALDERSVYSHTAVWPDSASAPDVVLEYRPTEPADLLADVARLAGDLGVPAFSASVRIRPGRFPLTGVRTRTLRHLPCTAIDSVDQAAALGAERPTAVQPGEELIAFGTYYPRIEERWEAMREGRPYEALGHYHCAIIDASGRVSHVAHLRAAVVGPEASVTVEFRAAGSVVKVDPVDQAGGNRFVQGSDGGSLNVFHRLG